MVNTPQEIVDKILYKGKYGTKRIHRKKEREEEEEED